MVATGVVFQAATGSAAAGSCDAALVVVVASLLSSVAALDGSRAVEFRPPVDSLPGSFLPPLGVRGADGGTAGSVSTDVSEAPPPLVLPVPTPEPGALPICLPSGLTSIDGVNDAAEVAWSRPDPPPELGEE